MADDGETPPYDLGERTFQFAEDVRKLVRRLPRTICNVEDVKQLIRASGSVGANYIEANESLSRKDFVMRTKICRKEAKESAYWLRLVEVGPLDEERNTLQGEAMELVRIFNAIVTKSE